MRKMSGALLSLLLACGPATAQQGSGSGLDSGGKGSPPLNTDKPPATAGCDPSFRGKYTNLIRRIPAPEDARQYGTCHDCGPWQGTEYKGHADLPSGAYWTYSAPNWYIWAKRGNAAAAAAGCPDPTFGGKYANELRRLDVPADRGRYGACNDYGPWTGNSYAGHTGLPNGYWVYSYPYWIIFATRGASKQ